LTSLDVLRRRWREERQPLPFLSAVTMHEDGLVLGAGTELARMIQDRLGRPCLAVAADRERLRALLFAAYGRPVPLNALKYVARASDRWQHGAPE